MNPYLIIGPALISFSGGRTSAFMLHQIIAAHGGTLPDDVVVTFANTGLEREETLRFVHECGVRWNVRIHWLEWRNDGRSFEEVGFNSASRHGEPFKALVAKKSYTPNSVTRFCTSELKIRVMRDFCRTLGWKNWTNVIGLRYDEGSRVLKAIDRSESGKEPWRNLMPMSKAKAVKRDVMRFWLGDNADPKALTGPLPQGFDLALRDYEGNCNLCMLKSKAKKLALIREMPGVEDDWIEMERIGKGRFTTEYSYAQLAQTARDQAVMPGILDDEEFDAECGLTCAPDELEAEE